MLAYISEILKAIFGSYRSYDNLDAFIAAGNPKTAEDVDILIRQFDEHRRNNAFTFFHE